MENKPEITKENEISLIDIFAVLFKKRWLIIIIAIIGLILGGALGKLNYKEKYTATASILLQEPDNVSVSGKGTGITRSSYQGRRIISGNL